MSAWETKMGQLKFFELRKRAEAKLGDKFDIKDFHNKILESGCITLKLFEDRINAWISSKWTHNKIDFILQMA